jgi:hypothetical protein
MSCSKLNAALPVTCAALERVGGINKRVWIANLEDIASYTISSNVISAITMASTTYFYPYVGDKDRHSTAAELQVGETVNSFKQMVNLTLFTSTSPEDAIIENLCDANDLVIIVEANDGQFEIFGLDVYAGSNSYPTGGLRCESATKGSGATINERAPWAIVLSGTLRNVERKVFSTDYATTIALIEALEP